MEEQMFKFFNSTAALSRNLNYLREKFRLTAYGVQILHFCQIHKNINQNTIANFIGYSKATAGIEIKRLAKNGLLKRTTDSVDARNILIEITPKGIETLNKVGIVFEKLFSESKDSLREFLPLAYHIAVALHKEDIDKYYSDAIKENKYKG